VRHGRNLTEQTVAAGLDDTHGSDRADTAHWRAHLHRLQIGRTADDLARKPARLFEQNVERAANERMIEGSLLALDQILQPCKPARLHGFFDLHHFRCRRAGAGAVLERIGLGEAHALDEIEGRREVVLRLSGEADDKIGGDRDIGARRARSLDDRDIQVAIMTPVHDFEHPV
jgi:hypothetical protein